MEHREEEMAACRYISHRTSGISFSAQAELLFQLGPRRLLRVTGSSECAGLNRHLVGMQEPDRKGSSESILASGLAGDIARCFLEAEIEALCSPSAIPFPDHGPPSPASGRGAQPKGSG